MPTVVVEDGSKVSGANAYVDPAGAFATAFFAGRLYSDAWNNATLTTREQAVIMAARAIDDGMNWHGLAANDDQALRWPRIGMKKEAWIIDDNVIPEDLQRANLEQAIALISRERTNPEATTAETKSISIGKGAVSLEFTAGTSSAAESVTVIVDAAWRMLRYYGTPIGASGSRIARVVR